MSFVIFNIVLQFSVIPSFSLNYHSKYFSILLKCLVKRYHASINDSKESTTCPAKRSSSSRLLAHSLMARYPSRGEVHISSLQHTFRRIAPVTLKHWSKVYRCTCSLTARGRIYRHTGVVLAQQETPKGSPETLAVSPVLDLRHSRLLA